MPYETVVARDVISRPPASNEELGEIVNRLHSTLTKSATGQTCKTYNQPKCPGTGLKMLPTIEGLESRFTGKEVAADKEKEVRDRLHGAGTKASSARYQNPRILLYPERTLLMNNVERIVAFQQSGAVAKQNVLARREKWFN